MATQFVCPQCKYTLKVDETPGGCNAKCPNCEAITPVPGEEGYEGLPSADARYLSKPNEEKTLRETRSHLPFSIVCTFLCCLPFGMIAMVYSIFSISYADSGKLEDAQKYSQKAWFWINVSLVCGGVIWGFMLFWNFLGVWSMYQMHQMFLDLN